MGRRIAGTARNERANLDERTAWHYHLFQSRSQGTGQYFGPPIFSLSPRSVGLSAVYQRASARPQLGQMVASNHPANPAQGWQLRRRHSGFDRSVEFHAIL